MRPRSAAQRVRRAIDLRRALLWTGLTGVALGLTGFSASLLADPEPMPLLATVSTGIDLDSLDGVERPGTVVEPGPAVEILSDRPSASEEIRWFNGRPIRPARTLTMLVTAYSPDERSCGASADGITASGYSVWTNGMSLVAADTSLLPFGSLVSVPGYDGGSPVPVLDRGGAIKGHRLDVLYATHERARQWGVQELEVVVWEYADGRGSEFRTAHRR